MPLFVRRPGPVTRQFEIVPRVTILSSAACGHPPAIVFSPWFVVCTIDGTPMGLIHTVIGFAVTIGILYFLTTYQQRDPEEFLSAYRLGLTIALVVVLLALIPRVRAYAGLVMQTTRESHRTTSQLHKLSASNLQDEYLRARVVTSNAGLRCTRAERDWDYVCSYMPTPFKSKARQQFGVIVDDTRVLKTSRPVPEGTTLPPPQ